MTPHSSLMICGEPERITYRGKLKNLCVDHCHTTEKPRGLLCHTCNLALGQFEDSIHKLKNAIRYLRQYSGVGIG